MRPDFGSWGLRKPNSVTVIVGGPGEGKTVLAYDLVDYLRGDRPVFTPMTQQYGRPKAYHPIPKEFPKEGGYVVLYTDASTGYNAREFMSPKNIDFGKILSLRRHDDVDVVIDLQNSGDLDMVFLRATDCLVLKAPSLLQEDMERPVLRKKYEQANELIAEHGGWDRSKAVVFTHKRSAFVVSDIEPPSYYNSRISKDDQHQPASTSGSRWSWDVIKNMI